MKREPRKPLDISTFMARVVRSCATEEEAAAWIKAQMGNLAFGVLVNTGPTTAQLADGHPASPEEWRAWFRNRTTA